MLGEKPSQYSLDDSGRGRDAVEGSPRGALARGAAAAVTTSATRDSEPAMEHAIETVHDTSNIDRATKAMAAPSGKRWWLLAAVSALLLTGLTIAGIYLVTKKPSTVDQLV